MEKQRIFVDMDGTLYEWRKNVPEEAIFQQYYYLTLKPQKNIVSAVRELAKDDRYEFFVLSAVLSDKENPYALAEKNQRIDIDLPEIDKAHRIFCPCGVPKAKYIPGGIRPNDILLDDYSHNLHEWGGIGIKVINDVNGRHGTWLGERIYANTTPRVLVKKITEIAEQTRGKETQTKETTFLIPADRSDPCVYFRGTKEEQEEADRIEEERKALWQSILDLPGFVALEFDRGDDSVILSPSVHEGVKWQLTWFSNRDGEANMDATYGGEKATHPESELIDALYRETRTTGARVSVVTEQSLLQKEEENELER